MAPNLAAAQHDQIRDMILSGELTNVQITRIVGCSERSIQTIRLNLRLFGTTRAPRNGGGRPKSISPPMLSALCERLIEKPDMYRDEMVVFLYDEFDTLVTRKLRAASRKSGTQTYETFIFTTSRPSAPTTSSTLTSLDAISVLGSGGPGGLPQGLRRCKLLDSTVARDIRFCQHIHRTALSSHVYSKDRLMPPCSRTSSSRYYSTVADGLNQSQSLSWATLHSTARTRSSNCVPRPVKLLYLPPYSPDLNPIEEFFAELKAFIKRNWQDYAELPRQDFEGFLEWCVDTVGARKKSAESHFRHAGISIEEPYWYQVQSTT